MSDPRSFLTKPKWARGSHLTGQFNFVAELEQRYPIIAALDPFPSVEVDTLIERFGLRNRPETLSLAATNLAMRYVNKMTVDDFVNKRDDTISEFAKFLGASIEPIENALNDSRTRLFRAQYEEWLSCQSVDPDAISDFGTSIGLDHQGIQNAMFACIKPIIDAKIAPILADPYVSPDFDAELEDLGKRLGVSFRLADPETERIFELGRRRWELDQGILPIVASPLMLNPKEICHGVIKAHQYSVRIQNGQQLLQDDGLGTLLISNTRLLFSGYLKNTSINLVNISDWVFYTDGVEIRRGGSKPVTFQFGPGNQYFCETLVAARQKYLN